MKIRHLEFIPKSELHKLGKCGDMSVEEFVVWIEQQKKAGRRVAKFFNNIYNKVVADSEKSETGESVYAETFIDEAGHETPEDKYMPIGIDKDAGLFFNLKKAFSEIGEELSGRIGVRKYDAPMVYPTAPNETFPLKLVADVLKEIYGNNKTIKETALDLRYVNEHIRNVHSRTVEVLIAGNSICNNIRLQPDLIAWSKSVSAEYVMRSVADLVDAAGRFDEQDLSILGFDSVEIGNTDIMFIIPKGKKKIYSNIGAAIISVLRDIILPLGKEDIIEKVERHHKMAKVEDYDETFIENVLYCKDLIESDKGVYWLKTEHLASDQQKMARLIFDEQKPISSCDAQNKFEKLYGHRMSSGLGRLNKYGLKNIHGNIWAYSESELKPLHTFIDNYAREYKVFYYPELLSALKSAGYVIPDSIRSYITNVCQVDNKDK